jgi:hypothetical protein
MLRAILALFSFSLLATTVPAAEFDIGTGDNFPKEAKVGDVIKFERVVGLNKVEIKLDGKLLIGKKTTDKATAITKIKYEVKAEKAGTLEIEFNTVSATGMLTTRKYKIDVQK